MSYQGYAAYHTAQTKADDPRDLEYRLLAQVTGALLKAKDNPNDIKTLIDAALWNRDVWSALRVDLADDNNGLPKQLRAAIISISLWIEKETHNVMDGKGDVDALIDINRNIMAGLKPDADKEAPHPTA